MTSAPGLVTRVALFSALVYVVSWGTFYLPNVSLGFFVVFTAGYIWGVVPGMLVGAIGTWLWTSFNPYGPATLPVMIAQIVGMAACGAVGAGFRVIVERTRNSLYRVALLVLAAIACTLSFYLPVSAVDAWVYQPFWPRLVSGLAFSALSLGINCLIFPLLFKLARPLYDREQKRP